MEITVKINSKEGKKYKSGYPLILKSALMNPEVLEEEGSIIKLVDEKGQFIGKGYFGIQNKGYGWLLTKNEKETIDQDFFNQKIMAAINRRKPFFENTDTTAFRLFNGEGDGIGGLTIDYFEGYCLINWYSKGIFKFKDYIIHSITSMLPVKGIYEKKRFDTAGMYIEDDDFVTGERAQFPLIVKENGVKFAIYLNEGAMVGVFLDQRDVRMQIRDKYAKGKTVLNTFSYTGAFSVFAALGGAKQTTSVDLANRSLQKTQEQFEVNGLDPEKQEILVMDVFKYFKYAVRKQLLFDLVILDPPSFARSKKHTFSAAKDYTNLLKEAIAITEKGGVIVASTNASNFGMDKFKGFIDQAFIEMKGKYQLLEEFSLPQDFKVAKEFKEGNYLKVVFIRKIH
ncbi:class I SAM-dependent rRNA methyltransferase [Bacillus carboniphilus]|uniref:Class I SAM-dependent rRNA methyltransferase n=1 Tax=Bacillus carboniphilus TaxID=86663 RepID=A0ABP3G566_9BACI